MCAYISLPCVFLPQVRAALIPGGIMSRVFLTMDDLAGDPLVQGSACTFLASATVNSVENQAAVVSLEGLRRVYAAMDLHNTDPWCACAPLPCLCRSSLTWLLCLPQGAIHCL